jgi:outer membrane receptor protein involved in Fe transport
MSRSAAVKGYRTILAMGMLLTAFSFFAIAQGTGKISGTVKDQNGAVIPGATVSALNIASSQRVNAETDVNGKYEFTGLRAAIYRVTATASGFGESAESVSLADGASEMADLTLFPGGIKDVVTVTAGKGTDRLAVETPQTVSVATADQIEQRLPRSTFEAMERTPNLGSIETSPARERPRLRGLSSTRLLVVIDGEKLNNARSDPGASGAPIAVVDPSQLQAIEVVAGSGSSLYGSDAIGGTINLITKVPTRPTDGVNLGVRFDGNYSSNGEVRRGNLAFTLGSPQFAARASINSYRHGNYSMGSRGVPLAEVLSIGQFFRQFPTNAAGTTFQSAANYPIYSLAPNQEILNGGGSGFGEQIDGWFYPNDKHNFRGRYLNKDDGNNGNAFSGPTYETQERYGSYRRYSKLGLRYEGLDLVKYIPRVSANYFHQILSFPQNQYTYVNLAGAAGSYLNATTFTGQPSVFVSGVAGASYTDNRNTINTDGVDLQATISPFRGLFATVGGGRTKDYSRDSFFVAPFSGYGANRVFGFPQTIGASSPVTTYVDNNFYTQAEFDRLKWVRLTAGMRYDKWKTNAQPGNGFPLSTEGAVLNASIGPLTANPGALGSLVAALPGLVALATGTGSSSTDRSSVTYNFGIVGRLPYGINPYFRWATSYREPGITERYLIRNFSPGSFFASMVYGNPNLSPEKGKNYDVGLKIQQRNFNFSVGYFHNDLTNFISFAPAQNYCVTAIPGVLPGSAAAAGFGCAATPPFQAVISVNARINNAAAVIKGWESTGEASIPLPGWGSMNPFFSLGSLHGTNKSPTPVEIAQFNAIYNRTTTPIPLTGSLNDFPLGNITPFRFLGGFQFLEKKGRYFLEYNARKQTRVTRAAPGQFVGTALINHGSFASTNGFVKQSIKGGYNWTKEKYKISFNAGIDNIADRTFWEHFQNAPAPGRSFVFGMTTEIFSLFKWK